MISRKVTVEPFANGEIFFRRRWRREDMVSTSNERGLVEGIGI